MKTIYKTCIAAMIICTCNIKTNATTVLINVEDFEFNPGDFTINIGDTVKWMWDNSAGPHNTTSTTIPVGALAWSSPITSSNQVFTYIPTIAGSYNYNCTDHFSIGMTGHFTVLATSGIVEKPLGNNISLFVTNPVKQELQIIYNIPKTTKLSIRIFNIEGAEVFTLVSATQNAGKYTQTFAIPNLSKGMYLITLETPAAVVSEKVLIQ